MNILLSFTFLIALALSYIAIQEIIIKITLTIINKEDNIINNIYALAACIMWSIFYYLN